MLWLIPAAILHVAVVPTVLGVRRVSREAASLRRELAAFVEARDALSELGNDVRSLAGALPELRLRTRPAPPGAP